MVRSDPLALHEFDELIGYLSQCFSGLQEEGGEKERGNEWVSQPWFNTPSSYKGKVSTTLGLEFS